MFSIKVEANFSSAHNLRRYRGKCEELHGHNWKVEVVVSSDKLDKAGMVLDFRYLKMKLHKILDKLDHKYLNKIPYFSAAGGSASGGKKFNPTSENIAQFIYDQLNPQIQPASTKVSAGCPPKHAVRRRTNLDSVTVWESDNSSATYYAK